MGNYQDHNEIKSKIIKAIVVVLIILYIFWPRRTAYQDVVEVVNLYYDKIYASVEILYESYDELDELYNDLYDGPYHDIAVDMEYAIGSLYNEAENIRGYIDDMYSAVSSIADGEYDDNSHDDFDPRTGRYY